jgi:hypothetical protein
MRRRQFIAGLDGPLDALSAAQGKAEVQGDGLNIPIMGGFAV